MHFCLATAVEYENDHIEANVEDSGYDIVGEDDFKPGIDVYYKSCSSPRWENLPSGHQRNPLLGLFGKVHVLGSKTIF